MTDYFDRLIKDEIRVLIDEKELCSGLTLAFGTTDNSINYNYGITGNNHLNVSNETIIDLASITKLFLSFAYFHLYDTKLVDFKRPISYYTNKFKNIKDFSIENLLHFNCVLKTQHRISNMQYEQAVDEIMHISGKISNIPIYSDMPSIVLGFLFEEISQMTFGNYVDTLVERLRLNNTFWHSQKKYNNFMDYSGEIQISNNQIKSLVNPPLLVNDAKARTLSNNGQYLCGHAGVFSNCDDMVKLSQALLSNKIISEKSLNIIGTVLNTNSEQRFGNLCYCKSPNKHLSEVPSNFSENAFAMSGFTGNYLCIDPQKKLFIFIGANKLSSRISKCDDSIEIADSIISVNNKKIVCSKDFVFKKDRLRDVCSDYLLKTF